MKLYQAIARSIAAHDNCADSDLKTENGDNWEDIHAENAEALIENFPHGSGLDGETSIDWYKSHSQRIVINSSYHCMDNGMYTHWIDFSLTITPDLSLGYNMNIKGNFSKPRDCQHLKEYLYEIFGYALDQDVEPHPGLAAIRQDNAAKMEHTQ